MFEVQEERMKNKEADKVLKELKKWLDEEIKFDENMLKKANKEIFTNIYEFRRGLVVSDRAVRGKIKELENESKGMV